MVIIMTCSSSRSIKESILSVLNHIVEEKYRATEDQIEILQKMRFELDDEFDESNVFVYTLKIFVDNLLIWSLKTSFDPREENEKYIIDAEEADHLLEEYEGLDREILRDFCGIIEEPWTYMCSKMCDKYAITHEYACNICSTILYIFMAAKVNFVQNIQ